MQAAAPPAAPPKAAAPPPPKPAAPAGECPVALPIVTLIMN